MTRWWLALGAAAFLSGLERSAHAQDGATLVAVVTAEPNAPLTRRVRAELQGLGVDVIVLKPPAESSSSMRAPLEQAARSVGAVAAVRLIVSSEGKVEVWVADRVTGKAVVRELDARERGTSSDAAVAIGTVELLRASLMELHGGAANHGDAPPTPKVVELAGPPPVASEQPSLPRLALALGGGASIATSRIGVSGDASLGIWVRLTPHLGARLVGTLTVAPAHVTTAAGAVDVRAQVVGGTVVYDLAEPTSTWSPSFGAGVAAAHVATTGAATPPFVGVSDAAWSAAPLLTTGLAYSVARGLRLRADALALWAIPQTSVHAPDETIGRWGAPQLMITLGVEVQWAR